MFLRLLKNAFRPATETPTTIPPEELLAEANRQMEAGERHLAIVAYKRYLQERPQDVIALNDMGCCLMDIGQAAEAEKAFLLAYAIDDTFAPAMANRAKLLMAKHLGQEAREMLQQAKLALPQYSYVDAIYASLQFKYGFAAEAKSVHLEAWLANFDHLRFANSVLWYGAYSGDTTEQAIASEHMFWGETVKLTGSSLSTGTEQRRTHTDKVKIGYWSPDLRQHSVNYFFSPLLANHDHSRFEIYIYYDNVVQDHTTYRLIDLVGERFHEVGNMPDADLTALIKSHELDVLVELAGHTSNNRLNLFGDRFARLQLTGIGYPSTTGLANIDGKWMDRHIVHENAARYYTERPFVLPSSFWCFDPMHKVPEGTAPPCLNKGHITFGCFGNVAKVTPEMVSIWKEILARVPTSRLRLRATSFADADIRTRCQDMMARLGLETERVDIMPPVSADDFFGAYNEVDIVLDTFPFHGGTTTAFALYMGVPVISLVGESLATRMGLSMLTNMGLSKLATTSPEAYVEQAVTVANDQGFLTLFRREARSRFKSSSLGNGAQFAREFEATCLQWLDELGPPRTPYRNQIAPLPAQEIMRRAYGVLRNGNIQATHRIVDHCLKHYPDCGAAHILFVQRFIDQGDYRQACEYLTTRLSAFGDEDKVAALITMARCHWLAHDRPMFEMCLAQLEQEVLTDPVDRMTVALLTAARRTENRREDTVTPESQAPTESLRVVMVVIASESEFPALQQHLLQRCAIPAGWQVAIERSDEIGRLATYRRIQRDLDCDALVILDSSVFPEDDLLLRHIQSTFAKGDIVSMAGCKRWARLDWRSDAFSQKAGCALTASAERPGGVEIQIQGPGLEALVGGMAVGDGRLLAIRLTETTRRTEFDDALTGADRLVEEAWTFDATRSGVSLVVNRRLGARLVGKNEFDRGNFSGARWAAAERYGFTADFNAKDDLAVASIPMENSQHALQVLRELFTD